MAEPKFSPEIRKFLELLVRKHQDFTANTPEARATINQQVATAPVPSGPGFEYYTQGIADRENQRRFAEARRARPRPPQLGEDRAVAQNFPPPSPVAIADLLPQIPAGLLSSVMPNQAPFSGMPYAGYDNRVDPNFVPSASGNAGGAPSTEPGVGRYPGLPTAWEPGGPHGGLDGTFAPMGPGNAYLRPPLPAYAQPYTGPHNEPYGQSPPPTSPVTVQATPPRQQAPPAAMPAPAGTQYADIGALIRALGLDAPASAAEPPRNNVSQRRVEDEMPNRWVSPWYAP